VTPVKGDVRLVDGRLRLEAAKLLGWTEIEVRVVDLDELRTELASIDANIEVQPLTSLELGEALARRKQIYEALNPSVRYGSSEMMRDVRRGTQLESRPPSFADATASRMGCSPGTVQYLVRIANAIPQDVRDQIRSTPVARRQSDLDRLSRCPEPEQRRIAEQIASGELQRVPKEAGRIQRWTPPDPETILLRAERALTRHISGRPDADVAVIPEALREIGLARSAWTPSDADEVEVPPNLSLDEIAALQPGQLGAEWLGPEVVRITKAGTPIAHVPVRRAKPSDRSLIRPDGDRRTAGAMGILGSCSHSSDDVRSESGLTDVIADGLFDGLVRVTLPADGDASLGDRVPQDPRDEVMAWRVDCEGSIGDLSICLGILQVWCESNPDQSFATICSDRFQPSDAMLAWLSACDNVVVGHSVSACLPPEELDLRFAAIERFLEWGIPTVVWVVTDCDWDNGPVAERAVALVGEDRIIEEPHRRGRSQCPPVLHVNEAGPCSGNRHDGKKRALEFVSSKDGGPDDYVVRLADGTFEQPSGGVHSRCKGCTLRCGLAIHGKLERTERKASGLPIRRGPHTPFPSTDRQWYEVVHGDVREHLRTLDRQVHCVLTSPPYYGVKTYGHSPLEIGHERTPQEYIETLCDVFDSIPLHPLGSCWVNLRDTRRDRVLLGIPERFVLEMEGRGWKLLDRVAWCKSALLPDGTTHGETMTERVYWRLNGNGWEYLFRFSRTSDPWYDPCAHLIPRLNGDGERYLSADRMVLPTVVDGRIPPDVWLFGPDRSGRAHLAPMPPIVCEIPIALTCPLWVNADGSLPQRVTEMVEYDDGKGPRRMGKYTQTGLPVDGGQGRNDTGSLYIPRKPESVGWTDIAEGARPGVVYDPFAGVGTTGIVALRLGRSFLGCELYPQHAENALKALGRTVRQLSGDLRPEADPCERVPAGTAWDESDDLTEVAAGGCL